MKTLAGERGAGGCKINRDSARRVHRELWPASVSLSSSKRAGPPGPKG